jgi:uncharacterized membrane protein YqhA
VVPLVNFSFHSFSLFFFLYFVQPVILNDWLIGIYTNINAMTCHRCVFLHLISTVVDFVATYFFLFIFTAADIHVDQLEQSEETRGSGQGRCRGHDFHFVS